MIDVLLDEDNDLAFSNGDLLQDESSSQNVDLILNSFSGAFKPFPFVGFGLLKYLKTDTSEARFKRELKIQLNYDGYNNPSISYRNGVLEIDI